MSLNQLLFAGASAAIAAVVATRKQARAAREKVVQFAMVRPVSDKLSCVVCCATSFGPGACATDTTTPHRLSRRPSCICTLKVRDALHMPPCRLPLCLLSPHGVPCTGTFEPELMFAIAKRNGLDAGYPSIEAARAARNFGDLQSFLDIYYAACAVVRAVWRLGSVVWLCWVGLFD